jgi:hypothetical protein
MVHAHQGGRVRALSFIDGRFRQTIGRRRPTSSSNARYRAQGAIEFDDQAIHRKRLTEKKRAPEGARFVTLKLLRSGESR